MATESAWLVTPYASARDVACLAQSPSQSRYWVRYLMVPSAQQLEPELGLEVEPEPEPEPELELEHCRIDGTGGE